MIKKYSLLLACFVLVVLTASISLGIDNSQAKQVDPIFLLIDNFDNFENGSINAQGAWTGNGPGAADDGLVVDTAPGWFTGKALQNSPKSFQNSGNAFRALNEFQIVNNQSASFYFQVSIDDLSNSNLSLGLSRESAPDIFSNNASPNHFDVEINFSEVGMRVRDGNEYVLIDNISMMSNRLYHIWIIVNHSSDTFEVAVDNPYGRFEIAQSNFQSNFGFRNGSTSSSLKSFVIQNIGLNSSDAYIDDLYIALNSTITTQPTVQFKIIDDFEALSNGTINLQNGWQLENGTAEVVTDPSVDSNKVVQVSGTTTELSTFVDPKDHIIDGSQGTLFFRIYREGTINGFVGLSDESSPSAWDDYDAQFGVQFDDPDQFRGRDGDGFVGFGNTQFNEFSWYCVWMVIDQSTNQYKMYTQGGPLSERTQLTFNNQTDLAFRNGDPVNPLQSVFLRFGQNSTGRLFVDDLFIDPNAINFTRPSGSCPQSTGPNPNIDYDAPLSNPIPAPIQTDGTRVTLNRFAEVPNTGSNPETRINYLYHAKDGSNRLFVNDLRGELFVINTSTRSVSEYIDLKDFFPNFKTSGSLNAGFSTFAFHPDFETNGKFYTVHYEFPTVDPDYEHPNTRRDGEYTHSVIVEWDANNPSLNTYQGAQPRELLRILQSSALHGVQLIEFNRSVSAGEPDYGMLYISMGDSEQEPFFSNVAQDLTYPQGKLLRIDPLGTNGPNGAYGIPNDNPFADPNDGVLDEIYAIGFRNPIRFDWDPVTKMMLLSVVGQRNAEEIELIIPGANYGWNEREGTFRFDTSTPDVVYPIPPNDNPDFVYPVAQYDHDEGFAMIGGFVYRGQLMPRLNGTYIFGDIVNGKMFYINIDDIRLGEQATIRQIILEDENGSSSPDLRTFLGTSRADLRFGLDESGEIYVMSKQNGVIYQLDSDQPAIENNPPELRAVGNQTTESGTFVRLEMEANDPDGNQIVFSEQGLPSGLSIDRNSGIISGNTNQIGTFTVRITATDSQGASSSVSFTWIVTVPTSPTATATTLPIKPDTTPSPTIPVTGESPRPTMTSTPIPTVDSIVYSESTFLPFVVQATP